LICIRLIISKVYTRKQQLLECGSCAFAMGIPIFATLFGGKIMAGVSVVLFILLLMGEIFYLVEAILFWAN
jgi:hypothetical protein